MKRTIISITSLCFIVLASIDAKAQTLDLVSNSNKTNKMKNVQESKVLVEEFFSAFSNGDFNGIINSFHDDCEIIAVRNSERIKSQIYGSYKGVPGVREFISNLGAEFDTKVFTVENLVSEGNVVFANGKFTHELKSTGKLFSSDWALMCVIKNDKILEYHFYEDSEKFAEAYNVK